MKPDSQIKKVNNKKLCSSNSLFLKLHEISMKIFAIESELDNLDPDNEMDIAAWEELKDRYNELIEMGDNLFKHSIGIICNKCHVNLYGKPKINVENIIFGMVG